MTDAEQAADLLAAWCDATDEQDAQLAPKNPGHLGEVYRYGIRHTVTTAHVRSALGDRKQANTANAGLAAAVDRNAAIAQEANDEADRLRTRVAELEGRIRAASEAVEQRARAEDAKGIADVYCAWWDASALVDETLGIDANAAAPDRAERNNPDRRAENGPASGSARPPAELGKSGNDSAECLPSDPAEAHRAEGNER